MSRVGRWFVQRSLLNIIEKNGDKAEKKSLKILMNKLKKIKDSENLENSLQENLSNKTQENSNTNQNLSNSDVSNSLKKPLHEQIHKSSLK